MSPATGGAPLRGRWIVTTRDEQGELERLLAAAGAELVHMPLIEIVEPDDGGAALEAALSSLDEVDWAVVTSRHGARRVGAALARHPQIRLAAVGTRTAAEVSGLAGRPVDVVPARQTAEGLLAVMPPAQDGESLLLAQADRAGTSLADGLARLGYAVRSVVAYRTLLRHPPPPEQSRALAADAVAFASGSAARAWAEAIGVDTPPCVVAIGPTTAGVARAAGLQVTHVAADHSVEGLFRAIAAALSNRP